MGERGHTKGPWSVREYGDGDSLVVHAGEDWRICFMATAGSSPNAKQRIKANASLIAAAPDMLEALNLVKQLYAYTGPDADGFAAMVERSLDAALAKATPTGEASDV